MKKIFLMLCLVSSSAFAEPLNVLLYHHISDDTAHTTSTRVADFIAQLDHFEAQGYTVVDLEEAVQQIRRGEMLDEKSLALTFDDGFLSVCETAYPELKKRGLPFTVFITTEPISRNYPDYCSWNQLMEMADDGVTIANHTINHDHLVKKALSKSDWLKAVTRNIRTAQQTITDHIGHAPKLFAYPYGEYNNELKQWLGEQGYIAFGQQSGSIGTTSDWQALPRFNTAGNYASVSSLRYKISASPLPLDYANLPDPQTTDTTPTLSVELLPSNEVHYPHLQCFFKGQPINVDWQNELSFTVEPPKELRQGRHRINCTAPHRNGFPYYWLSQQWQVEAEQSSQ
ncbi:polysaccharide deacetylase family protein [Vibrio lamellibrachiae]|uniref:polysaccharide deacetylase family protein n=1 Tax=Vibrio lamellibrachiae TaxID=2910253 RepID=UPI003D0AE51F